MGRLFMEQMMKNIEQIKEEIEKACLKVGRNPNEVRLLAVSKTFPVEIIKEAYNAGQCLFGENRVQELCTKTPLLPADIEWHLIGTLQRNKVKNVLGKVALIHSVDSVSLAREIDKRAARKNLMVDVLLQVNVAGEKTKHGFIPEEVKSKVKEICKLPRIKIKGLMTMAPFTENPEEVRPIFRELRTLAESIEKLQLPEVQMKELSMGMSNDFRVAIEEGATLVRIGSRIFGTRNDVRR
jgi:pyridoxal phosphate enzyme (YggS family)